jgi:hypothetical protein
MSTLFTKSYIYIGNIYFVDIFKKLQPHLVNKLKHQTSNKVASLPLKDYKILWRVISHGNIETYTDGLLEKLKTFGISLEILNVQLADTLQRFNFVIGQIYIYEKFIAKLVLLMM